MLKLYSLAIIIALLCAPSVYAANNLQINHARSFIYSGQPEKAVLTAQELLAQARLSDAERKELLELISEAEFVITRAKHFEDVKKAVQSIKTLIKEFPKQVNEAKLLWDIAQLSWRQNDIEETQAIILDLQNRLPQSTEAKEGWLLLGKIHFINHQYAKSRNALLRFSLTVDRDSYLGRDVRMWVSLVDYEEKRYPQAFQAIHSVFQEEPELITQQSSIYARYIAMLDIQGLKKEALRHANLFLAEFKTSDHSAEVRLLRADLQLELPNTNLEEVIRTYSLLADKEANTVIGRQAFMRKMMIQMRDKTLYRDIKPVIIALKRIASQNQLSIVEDEALLHEARLWEKTSTIDAKHSPKSAAEVALQQFTHATSSINPRIASQATYEGKDAFKRQIRSLISQKEWLPTITLWERFPNFRPPLQDSAQLRYDVARGLRLLMEYEQASHILKQLHKQADGSVWGEKIMLERARLWMDRRDPQGVKKALTWLDKHEYTLYRPEMLVIVAHMQQQAKDTIAASQTLAFISPDDLGEDTQAEYWKIQALTSEDLSRWHISARAWRMYALQKVDDVAQAKLNEANALFKGKDYIPAEQLYSETPESMQTPAWQYRYSICQLKSGKWNQALERLTLLKSNPKGGIYTSMAALTLAEREAERLLEENPHEQ